MKLLAKLVIFAKKIYVRSSPQKKKKSVLSVWWDSWLLVIRSGVGVGPHSWYIHI